MPARAADGTIRYGFIVPGGPLEMIVDAGVEAEAAGWDGFFYYDGDARSHDPWIVLVAIAQRTERIRLGAVLVPLPWRRPWLVARALTTLDQLSHGRVILPIGLGAVEPEDWAKGTTPVGEPIDRRLRAELMDEGLEIITGLWSGEPLSHHGQHYQVEMPAMGSVPLQRPHVPIWVVGAWGSAKSMRRAFRYDGWLPARVQGHWPAVKAYLEAHRPTDRPFDVVVEGRTPGDDLAKAREIVQPLADAGATWWLETMWSPPDGPDDVHTRVRQGPPRL